MKEFWDERYGESAFVYGVEPNEFLVSAAPWLPAGAEILSLGEGEGRNALFLAKAGHQVTAVDQSDVGLAKAARLAREAGCSVDTQVADLADFDLGVERYDAIVSIFCHLPAALRQSIHARIKRALRPGGLYLTESYSPEQLQYDTGGPKDGEMLVSLDELAREFADFEQLQAYAGTREVNEGEFHRGLAAVTQFVGRKLLVGSSRRVGR
jgi:SAM-dependent methyltransferase